MIENQILPQVDLRRLIERNLNAISRTPKIHREELLRFVYRPQLVKLIYPSICHTDSSCQALDALRHLLTNLDIQEDPYVIMLKSDPSPHSSTLLQDTLRSHKTYCQQLMGNFYGKAENIYRELGIKAVEYFILSCVEKLVVSEVVNDFELTEKLYMKKILGHLNVPTSAEESIQDGPHLSPKVRCLINFLKDKGNGDFTGLVFVQTRASVAVLSHLLSTHVSTRDVFKISTFVGSSSIVGRKFNIGELLDVKFQRHTLDDLRHGRKNLVVTTSALEEGIDVSACNHVICFEKPPNFKSFIQRRGRARKKESMFIMMFEGGDDVALMSTWRDLEAEMMKTYMDDMRYLQEIDAIESQENGQKEFIVESTGYFNSFNCEIALTHEEPVQNLHSTMLSGISTTSVPRYLQVNLRISGPFLYFRVGLQTASGKPLVRRFFYRFQSMHLCGKLAAVLNGLLKSLPKEMRPLKLT